MFRFSKTLAFWATVGIKGQKLPHLVVVPHLFHMCVIFGINLQTEVCTIWNKSLIEVYVVWKKSSSKLCGINLQIEVYIVSHKSSD